jgi:hypothetical protein
VNFNSKLIHKLGIASTIIHGAKAQVALLKPITTTTVTTIMYDTTWLLSYFKQDQILFAVTLIGLLLSTITIIYFVIWIQNLRSYVYIEFRTRTSNLQISYKRLPDASRSFRVTLPCWPVKLIVVDCFLFGYIKFQGKLWELEDTRTNKR